MVVLVRPTAAAGISPYYSFNQSPVIQIYGLPAIGRAEVLNSTRLLPTTSLARR